MFAIALAYTVDPTSNSAAKCVVAFLVIYQFFYNWGISPYTFLIGGEIPAQRIPHLPHRLMVGLRAYTVGIAGSISYLGSWLVSYTAPFFINTMDLNWGPKYGWIWLPSNLICLVFVFFMVPETKDRSLEGMLFDGIG
jgi:MFS transporter, SP family, sugar:H+ symporter